MLTQLDLLPGVRRPNRLLVLLPPAKATLDDLVEQGFVAAVRARQLPVDVLLAEVSYAQVMAKTVASSLREQVIGPALARGYSEIWLGGISLGAFNALHYAAVHAVDLAGLHLLAPYPGTGDILREIEAAGGPAAWAALPDRSDADERLWWHWLWRESTRGRQAKPLYLGLGSDDRFIRGQRQLASLVPAGNIDEIAGDHSWPVWRALWQRWLDRGWLANGGWQAEGGRV